MLTVRWAELLAAPSVYVVQALLIARWHVVFPPDSEYRGEDLPPWWLEWYATYFQRLLPSEKVPPRLKKNASCSRHPISYTLMCGPGYGFFHTDYDQLVMNLLAFVYIGGGIYTAEGGSYIAEWEQVSDNIKKGIPTCRIGSGAALKAVRGYSTVFALYDFLQIIRSSEDLEIRITIGSAYFLCCLFPVIDDMYNEYYSYYTQTKKKKTWAQRVFNFDLDRKEVGQLAHIRAFQFGLKVGMTMVAMVHLSEIFEDQPLEYWNI